MTAPTPTIPEHGMEGDAGPLSPTAMFHLAAATLERGVELHSLTEDEIRVLVSATTKHIVDERDANASRADRAEAALRPFADAWAQIQQGHAVWIARPADQGYITLADLQRAAEVFGTMGDDKRAAALSDLAALDGESL